MSSILPCPPCLLQGGGPWAGEVRGGGGQEGGWGRGMGVEGEGGRGHFIYLAMYCTTTWCFALKGLRTITFRWLQSPLPVFPLDLEAASRVAAEASPATGRETLAYFVRCDLICSGSHGRFHRQAAAPSLQHRPCSTMRAAPSLQCCRNSTHLAAPFLQRWADAFWNLGAWCTELHLHYSQWVVSHNARKS